MTTFNHDKFLKDSINSIINQSYDNWQLVLVDNGSTDNTKYIIKKIKNKKIKKLFLKKNIGRTNSINYGLKYCKGHYIAILDSDDLAHSKRLELQLDHFNKNKELYLLGTDYNFIGKKKKK